MLFIYFLSAMFQGFKRCKGCNSNMPLADLHDKCLECLAGLGHDISVCAICTGFSPRAQKRREGDFGFYLASLAAKEKGACPPSKKSKGSSRKSSSSSSSKTNSQSSSTKAIEKPVGGGESVTMANLQLLLQQHMGTMEQLVKGSVDALRKEFTAAQTERTVSPPSAGAPASAGGPQEDGESVTGVPRDLGSGSPSSDTGDAGRTQVQPVRQVRGSGLVPPSVLASGPLSIPGLSRPSEQESSEQPKSFEAPVSGTAMPRAPRDRCLLPLASGLGQADDLQDSVTVTSLETASVAEVGSCSESEPESLPESDSNESIGTLNFPASLRVARQRIAEAIPEAARKLPEVNTSEFRLPGSAFAIQQPQQVQLRVLPFLVSSFIDPMLDGGRSRFNHPEMATRYSLEEDLFEVPGIDECVWTSVALGGASAHSLAVGAAKQGTRRLPPFASQGPLLKSTYKRYEETYKCAAQQLRVAVHGAYLVSLQDMAVTSSGDPGVITQREVFMKDMAGVLSHVSRDLIQVAASQMMGAVMGMR